MPPGAAQPTIVNGNPEEFDMLEKVMKLPSAAHPITLERPARRVRVRFGGRVVADSRSTIALKEASYRTVLYVPREDVDMSLLERSEHGTYCPYKGDASYFHLRAGERRAENAVWTYEDPYQAVAAIKDHLAFYPDRVDAIDEGEAA